MEKATVLNHIRVYPNGHVEAHFDLLITDEGRIVERKRHIGVVTGSDMKAYIAGVNKSLTDDLKMPPLDEKVEGRIKRIVDVEIAASLEKELLAEV